MLNRLSPLVLNLLVCPMCRGSLNLSLRQAECRQCGAMYPSATDGRPDLRLPRNWRCTIEALLGDRTVAGRAGARFRPIRPNPSPQLDYRSIRIPSRLFRGNRLTRQLLSYFPHSAAGGVMLDLGCGLQECQPLIEHTGLEYVGLDREGPAMLLADAHALPFRDNSFDFLIAFAVLEHLRFPPVALREAWRVLKPGCLLIGTAAFLEPWHQDSYWHPSPLGIHDALAGSGFDIRQMECNTSWHGLRAQACMSLFPGAPRLLSDTLVLPLLLLSRSWWRLRHWASHRRSFSEDDRQLANAGGFRFVAEKQL